MLGEVWNRGRRGVVFAGYFALIVCFRYAWEVWKGGRVEVNLH